MALWAFSWQMIENTGIHCGPRSIKRATPSKYKYDGPTFTALWFGKSGKEQGRSKGPVWTAAPGEVRTNSKDAPWGEGKVAEDHPLPVWTPTPGELRTNSKDAPWGEGKGAEDHPSPVRTSSPGEVGTNSKDAPWGEG